MISYKKAIIFAVLVGIIMSFSVSYLASARFNEKALAAVGDIFTPKYWKNLIFPSVAPMPSGLPQIFPSPQPPYDNGTLPSPMALAPAYDYESAKIAAVKRASPAVVSIIITKDLPVIERYYVDPFRDQGSGNDFFDQFFGQGFGVPQYRQNGTEKKEVGGGTGFIISADGLILTNKHVVEDTQAEYTVLTNDKQKITATVLARDPVLDIAVLKINKAGLPTVVLGDSDRIELGQTAIAIGNALGEFRNTVSVGVISGLSRQITAGGGGTSEQLSDLIQTDAAINPGNSGGPLLNIRGEVIGIDVAMVSGAQSIGFAIPINQAKSAIDSVKRSGKIVTPYVGVRYVLINAAIKTNNNLTVDYGALVRRGENPEDLAVIPGSPADKAGIVENDIILEVDGKKITADYDLATAVRNKKVGGVVTLKLLSKSQEKTVKVTLEERK